MVKIDEPTKEDPFPDAWCDACDLILEAHQGWNEESEKLIEIRLICSGCYEQSRIRNTRTDVSFAGLSSLRWKCGSCEEWHYGPCLDFTYYSPVFELEPTDHPLSQEYYHGITPERVREIMSRRLDLPVM